MITRYLFLLSIVVAASSSTLAQPPATRTSPTVDSYHGIEVQDPYRWLEDWDDAEVKRWSESQNAYTRKVLDGLPNVDAIRKRVTEIMSAQLISYREVRYVGGKYFAVKNHPPKEQPYLVTFDSLDSPESCRVLFDPNGVDTEGTTSMDWFEPSPDGRLVAISISAGGSEVGDVSVYDTTTAKKVFERVPRVNTGTAGGDLAWAPDNKGFYYTRHPRQGERPEPDLDFYQQLYFHQLGTDSAQDRFELGKDFPRIAEIEVEVHAPSGMVLCNVQNGDGGEFSHHVRMTDGRWFAFSHFGDKLVQATFEPSGTILAITRDEAPRGKIVRLRDVTLPTRSTQQLIPEAQDTIVTSFYHSPPSLVATANRIYVTYQLGGPSEIRVFDLDGTPLEKPQQLPISSVGGIEPLTDDDIVFHNHSYIEPTLWFHYQAASGETQRTKLSSRSPVDFSDVHVTREFATSKDGTQIPINILRPDSVNEAGPLVLYGYGGYAINLTPRFSAANKSLLEQGVTYAVANLRGGGEYGEDWHLAGNLTNKQNVFDDFYAAARFLIDQGYTTSDQLAIKGGSNGGLLMGATMTQHPELMKCVVSHVGIYDMLRVELSPNGSFNIPEFGTVKKRDQFMAMRAYSPYHNVTDGTKYPATIFFTGANDPRVDPMQSRKMTARLQSASPSSPPVLLRTSANSGHGGDTGLSQRIEEAVDTNAFLFHFLGVPFRSP
ncbi:prolyl oligopeptidase family serine peptidase [Novipirellula artificiosorum]|uniref:prolyl oligopeptidase n=1 Tax=Novipirellula artificiosorum TaxID=2528016 RepID=A0A5C6D2N7_9BACT|nr:prolyl oligopeptidase family serine peptidase [Novipirellula artificiosorum]TWU31202.1 Prolyl endopeptidase [Novipirellula artificiosorum]